MLVQFANTWLTNDGTGTYMERAWTSTQDLQIDGTEVDQEVPYVRALVQDVFDRGNMLHTLSFRVTRNFQAINPGAANPIALASAFALTHFAGLTKNGALVMTCGGWGETAILAQAAAAVLKSAKSTTKGVQVVTQYSFKFGQIVSVNPATDEDITDHSGTAVTDATNVPITES